MVPKFDDLGAPILNDPARRARAEEAERAIRDALGVAEVRQAREVSQRELAAALEVSQPRVAKIESQGENVYVSTLRRYVEGLGGHLEVAAVFDDGDRVIIGGGRP